MAGERLSERELELTAYLEALRRMMEGWIRQKVVLCDGDDDSEDGGGGGSSYPELSDGTDGGSDDWEG